MAEYVKRKVKVLEAKYIKEANSIVVLCQDNNNKFRNQIHKSCFAYGERTEEEIEEKLNKIAKMMIGKNITMIFDPDLDKRMENNSTLKY